MAEDKAGAGRRRIAVVGAGIVGVTCAYQLAKEGHAVTVVDRLAPGEGCSFGNAGLLARSSFVPLSVPATLVDVPGWLFDPLGPLAIRWSYLPKLAPWLVRFVLAGRAGRIEPAARALQTLCDPSVDLYRQLADEVGAAELIRESDYLQVYESEKKFARDGDEMRLREKMGVRIERLKGDVVREIEPALGERFRFAYRYPDHGFTVDPARLVKVVAEALVRAGGTVRQAEVRDVEIGADGPSALVTDAGRVEFDTVVIAAGADSGRLAAKLGAAVPLDTERGYHVTLPEPGVSLSRPVMAGEAKFLVTPMDMGLRLAGTVEFGGIEAPPNYARARVLLEHGRRMLPGLSTAGYSEWMGRRPSLPDSLPVIGRSPRFANALLAFGHQHVGLTCAPKTAGIVADLVAGRVPNIDIAPFGAGRF